MLKLGCDLNKISCPYLIILQKKVTKNFIIFVFIQKNAPIYFKTSYYAVLKLTNLARPTHLTLNLLNIGVLYLKLNCYEAANGKFFQT